MADQHLLVYVLLAVVILAVWLVFKVVKKMIVALLIVGGALALGAYVHFHFL